MCGRTGRCRLIGTQIIPHSPIYTYGSLADGCITYLGEQANFQSMIRSESYFLVTLPLGRLIRVVPKTRF